MARQLTANTVTKLAERFALKPVTIVEITWARGGTPRQYSDKPLTDIPGAILQVSGLDNTIIIQGGIDAGTTGDSQQISVILDDTSGDIKGIMDTTNVHKATAKVYQYFEGTDLDVDKVLLFVGEVSSPIEWNEGDRTVSCDILNRIEDVEVGFSIEEGFFRQENANVGDAWPLGFGTVVDQPALHIPSPRVGRLKTGLGVADHVLAAKIEQVGAICCPYVFKGWNTQTVQLFNEQGFPIGTRQQKTPTWGKDNNCECNKRALTCEFTNNYNSQVSYQKSSIEVTNGELFPQDVQMSLYIEGAKIVGYFNGTDAAPSDTFVINTWVHPRRNGPVNKQVHAPEIKVFRQDCTESEFISRTLPEIYAQDGIDTNDSEVTCTITSDGSNCTTEMTLPGGEYTRTNGAAVKESFDYLANFREAGFVWLQPGVDVNIWDDQNGVHIVNLLPSTVHTVKAYRTFPDTNFRQLATVPAEFYEVRNTDYNGYTVTEIVTPTRLSLLGDGWEDALYVSYTSTVGPNMVDIMEWLIDTYGGQFTVDGSFNTLRSFFDAYPMHFVLPERKNLLDVLRELAFQNRCSILLRNNVLTLKYLSQEPATVVNNISEDHVLVDTLKVGYSDTEALVTKFVANWRPDGANDKPYKVSLLLNTDLYGTKEESFEFYAFKHRDLVLKSATFWMYRMANSWKKVTLQVPINLLELESLDYIDITLPDVADGTVKALVETAVLNTGNNTIDLILWVPVKAGRMDVSPTAWPGSMSQGESIFETDDVDNVGASVLNAAIQAPDGHPLAVNFTASEDGTPAGGEPGTISIGVSDWSSTECGEGALHSDSYYLCGYEGTDDEQASDWDNSVDSSDEASYELPQQPYSDLEALNDIQAVQYVTEGQSAQNTNDNTEAGYQNSGGRDNSVGGPTYETGLDSEGNEQEFGPGEAADMDPSDYNVPAEEEFQTIKACTAQDAEDAGYVEGQSASEYDAARDSLDTTLSARCGGFYRVDVLVWSGPASSAIATVGATKSAASTGNTNTLCTGGIPENAKIICGVQQCWDLECCDTNGDNCSTSTNCLNTNPASDYPEIDCYKCQNYPPSQGCTNVYSPSALRDGGSMYFQTYAKAMNYARQMNWRAWNKCGGFGTGSQIASVSLAHVQEGGRDIISHPTYGAQYDRKDYTDCSNSCVYNGSGDYGIVGYLPARDSYDTSPLVSLSGASVESSQRTTPWGATEDVYSYAGGEATTTDLGATSDMMSLYGGLDTGSTYDRTDTEGDGKKYGNDAMTDAQAAQYNDYLNGHGDNLWASINALSNGDTIPSCQDCMCGQDGNEQTGYGALILSGNGDPNVQVTE